MSALQWKEVQCTLSLIPLKTNFDAFQHQARALWLPEKRLMPKHFEVCFEGPTWSCCYKKGILTEKNLEFSCDFFVKMYVCPKSTSNKLNMSLKSGPSWTCHIRQVKKSEFVQVWWIWLVTVVKQTFRKIRKCSCMRPDDFYSLLLKHFITQQMSR